MPLPTSFSFLSDALSFETQLREQRLQGIIHLYCVVFVFKDKKKYINLREKSFGDFSLVKLNLIQSDLSFSSSEVQLPTPAL